MEQDLASLTEKVRPIPHKRAFFRWVTAVIETSSLPTENHERRGKVETYDFTAESKAQIRAFVDLAVTAFNNTHHLIMTVTPYEVYEEVYGIWQQDVKAHERQELMTK